MSYSMDINFHEEVEGELPIVQEEASVFSFEKAVQTIVTTGVFLMPLFFLPWTSDYLEFQKQTLLIGLAGVGLVVWLIGVIKKGRIRTVLTRLGVPVMALIAASGLAALFSLEPSRSFLGSAGSVSSAFSTWTAAVIFFFLAISSNRVQGRDIERTLIISSLIAILFGVLQAMGLFSLPFGFLKSRAFTTIGSLNSVGVFAAILFPLLVGFQHEDNAWKWVRNAGIVLSIFTLILFNWWVIWVIAMVGMTAVVAMQSFAHGFSPSKFVIPMTVIVIGIFFLLTGLDMKFLKNGMPTEVSPSYALSFQVAKETLREKPVFGYGPENFVYAYDLYGAPVLADTAFSNVRFFESASEFFNSAVQTGIVGILAVLFFIYGIIKLFVSRLRYVSVFSGEGAAVIAVLTAYFLYSFNMAILFLMWAVLALCVIRLEGQERAIDSSLEDSPRYALASSVGFIIGLIIVLAGSYYTVVRYIADVDFANASTEKNSDEAVSKLISAINLNPYESRYYRYASNVVLTKINEEIIKKDNDADRPARIQGLINASLDAAKRSVEKNPHDSENWIQQGFVFQNLIRVVSGAEEPAVNSYQEALKRNPSDPSIYNRIGQVYLARSEINTLIAQNAKTGPEKTKAQTQSRDDILKAQENFKMAADLNRNFGAAIYNLASTYERQGKVKEAISQIEKLIPFNASNAGLVFELGLLYYQDNRKNDSLAAFQRAVEISPKYANAHWYLALLSEEKGDLDGAVTHLEKILESDVGNQTVLNEIENIRAGKPSVVPPEKITDQQPLELQQGQ